MDVLMHVDAVGSPHNVKGLRRLYDLVESNVRSLKSLGVESSSYGSLLASVLIIKIPSELQLIVSKKIGGDDWNLDALMTILSEELQARERTTPIPVLNGKKPSKEPMAAALVATALSCVYIANKTTPPTLVRF